MTTGTQGWHADPALLSSYLAGDLDAVTGASVEQHVSRARPAGRRWGAARAAAARAHLGRHPRRRRAPDPALPDAARPAARSLGADGGAARLGGFVARRLAGRRLPVAVLRHVRRLRVRAERRSRRSSSRRPWRRCSGVAAAYGPSPGPARGAGCHRAVRAHPADPAAHVRRPGVGAAGHRAARARRARAAVARRRVARPGPGAGAGAARAGRLRRAPGRGDRRVARVVRRRARLDAASSRRPGRSRPRSRASTSGWPWPPAPSSRSGPAPTGSRGWRCERRHRRATGVGKRYGRTRALADVDLAFDRGVTGLLGPNGAGKTTLLRIVATSIAADSGEVRLLGRDPHRSHADVTAVRRELGYLPQELGYPADMTAFGFIEYIAVLKEWNDREARHQEVRRVLEPGRARRPGRRADQHAVRWAAPTGRAGAGAARGPADCWCSTSRPPASTPTQRADLRGVRCPRRPPLDGAAVHPPDRGRRGPVRAGGRARRRHGAVRRCGHRPGRHRGGPGLARRRAWRRRTGQWRTGTGRHHVVGGRPPVGADPAEPTLEDAYLLMLGPDGRSRAPGSDSMTPFPDTTPGPTTLERPMAVFPPRPASPGTARWPSSRPAGWPATPSSCSASLSASSCWGCTSSSSPTRQGPPGRAHAPLLGAFYIGLTSVIAAALLTRSTEVAVEAVATAPGTEARRTLALAAPASRRSGRAGVLGRPRRRSRR